MDKATLVTKEKKSDAGNDKLADDVIKIIVIGDATVGKTSFIDRYVNDQFTGDYKCTIGVDFVSKLLESHGGTPCRIKLQFWDIAGQDRFPLLTRSYYRYTRGCILMFDLTCPTSFENVIKWKTKLDMNADDNVPVPCLLVGNKADLPVRKISYAQIEDMCKEHNFIQWTETSVKDGTMVCESVTYLLDVILKRSPNYYMPGDYVMVDAVSLTDEELPVNRRKKSCKICS